MANTKSLDLEADSNQCAIITDANQTGLDITGDMTLEGWFKFETDSGTYLLNKWGVVGDLAYALTYESGGTGLRLRINNGTSTTQKIQAWTPSTGTWYHIAVTYDASEGECKFYINGSQLGSTQTGLHTSINDNNQPFAIGVNYNNGGLNGPMDGKIDEVRVWNDVRTETEINDNKSIQLAGTESGLVANWRFNDTPNDETSNDNDLNLINTPSYSIDVPFVGALGKVFAQII